MKKQRHIFGESKRITLLITLGIMVLLLFLTLVSAESLGTFKQGEDINLIQVCSSCTYNNLSTIKLADGSLLAINEQMQKDGTFYNWTLNSTYATSIGEYKVNGFGDLDGVVTIWVYSFEVTPNGLSQSTSQGIGSAVFLFLMVILMFVFGFMGFKLSKTENLWLLGVFFMFISLIFLVYNTWLGYEYHRLFTGLSDSSIPMTIFYMFMVVLVIGILGSITLLILKWKKVFRYIKKEIKRKEPDDSAVEDWDVDHWAGEDWKPR